MIYERPKNEIFASDAKDGEIVDFPNVKRGWGITENLGFIPPMEYFNAAFNRVDKSIAYQLQRGVAEWDKDLEYPIGAVVSLNGVVYVAKSQNTNKNPANEVTIWDIVATQKWCEDSFLKKTDDKFALKDDLPELATEAKSGIVKLKNSITAKQEDAAVTEKAVAEAIEANKGLGIGQAWQNMTAQRKKDIVYTNTTNRAIIINVAGTITTNSSEDVQLFINNVLTQKINIGSRSGYICAVVPAGSTYKVTTSANSQINPSSFVWVELR